MANKIRPYHYEISLSPETGWSTFRGDEKIHINVIEPTDTLILNAVDIEFQYCCFKDGLGHSFQSKTINIQSEDETVSITFSEVLPVGNSGILEFSYSGNIRNNLNGLYKSKYISPNGTVSPVLVTQFEPMYARMCFPCWDDPALKATFTISLTVPRDLMAISNMPVKESTLTSHEFKTVTFETTPVMSTYLVAIAVGEFDYIEDQNKDGLIFRVYTRKGRKDQGELALRVAMSVITYYTSYFNIPYPLPKLDSLAIADFDAGAMENWGLIIYRETRLLYDSLNTSTFQKQWISIAAGHEIAHQWFGNLVTMKSWNDLWLNEGYASFEEYQCVDNLFPQYDVWMQFMQRYNKVLELDALKSSHPIEVSTESSLQALEVFDQISYFKGASVIRMLHDYIGDDSFRQGMHLYLDKHAYSNATTNDLWNALEQASKKTVGQIMSPWTTQVGFPLIKIEELPCSEINKRILRIYQERFYADGTNDKSSVLWTIPLKICDIRNLNVPLVNEIMNTPCKDFVIECAKDVILKANPGHVGFYRTTYDITAFAKFLPAIEKQILPPCDRIGLLNDLAALCQAGNIPSLQIFNFLLAYRNETHYVVWNGILNVFNSVGILIAHDKQLIDVYNKFGRYLLENIYLKLGWDPKPEDSHMDALLRTLVLDWLVTLEYDEVLSKTVQRFDAYYNTKLDLPPDLCTPVYRGILRSGDSEAFDKLLKLYKETDLNEEQERILMALGAAQSTKHLNQTLEFSLSENVRKQDGMNGIISVARNHPGKLLAWNFFKKHYDVLCNRYKGTHFNLLIKPILTNIVSEEFAKTATDFFAEKKSHGIKRQLQQIFEELQMKCNWLKRDGEDIAKFLLKRQYIPN